MTEQAKQIEAMLTNIRAYAKVIDKNNWRDIQLRMEIEFKALAATYAEIVEK